MGENGRVQLRKASVSVGWRRRAIRREKETGWPVEGWEKGERGGGGEAEEGEEGGGGGMMVVEEGVFGEVVGWEDGLGGLCSHVARSDLQHGEGRMGECSKIQEGCFGHVSEMCENSKTEIVLD